MNTMRAPDLVTLYRESEVIAPDARIQERTALLSLAGIEPQHIVCDMPAWGGYLSRGIDNPARLICLDPNERIVNCPGAKIVASSPSHFAIGNASVDRVVSLVGMHHLTNKATFINESFRVLRSGGRAVMSEVMDASPVARFLNGTVNRYNPRGHKGIFVKDGELSGLLSAAGFTDVREEVLPIKWQFSTIEQMAAYCQKFFAMTLATEEEIRTGLLVHLKIEHRDDAVWLPWSLVYVVGSKP